MQIYFSKKFGKKLNKMSVKNQKKTEKRVKLFKEDQRHPLLKNHKLHGEFEGKRSINITSDIRAIYSILRKATTKLSSFFLISALIQNYIISYISKIKQQNHIQKPASHLSQDN